MNKGIYRIAAGIGAAVILVSSCTVQASMVMTNGTPAAVATDSIANWPAAPAVTSETAVLMDADTGAILYDKGMDEYRYPASTTKLMTLLIAIENSSPKDVVTFTETGVRDVTWDSSNINAQLGETMTMKDCWFAAYIKSANEVCAQIAEYVGGTEANFVEMMNQKALELGLVNTHFVNCTGFDEEGHYTCAQDVATMARELMTKHGEEITKYSTIWMDSLRNGETELVNTNRLVRFYDGTTGLKTGTTDAAGHCLCATATRNGMSLISVIMGCQSSDARFEESKQLLDYGFSSFMIYEGELTEGALDPIKVVRGEKTEVIPRAQTMPKAVIRKEEAEQMQVSVERPEQVEAPLEQGQQIGSVVLLKNGQEVSREPLTATDAVGELTFGKSLRLLCRSLVTMQ